MPDWLTMLLLAIFVVHLVVFGVLLIRRREKYYAAVTLTFLLLTATFAVRLWAPDAAIGDLSLFWSLRIAAWCSAAVSITWLLSRRFGNPDKGIKSEHE